MSTVEQNIETALSAPEAQVVLSVFKDKVLSDAQQVVDGFVKTEITANPNNSRAEIINTVTGDVWHYLRGKWGFMGFLVDILRNVPSVSQAITDFVSAEFDALAVLDIAPAPVAPVVTPDPAPVSLIGNATPTFTEA